MNSSDVETLLSRLGCTRIKTSETWVNASCPFAPFSKQHKSGTDSHPSFGVRVNDTGKSAYHCFACGLSGSLHDLLFRLKKLHSRAGQNVAFFDELFLWVSNRDREVPLTATSLRERLSAIQELSKEPVLAGGILVSPRLVVGRAIDRDDTVPEDDLRKMAELPPEALAYIEGRKISPKTIWSFGLKWHEDSRRIAIPIRDFKQRLVGISGRSIAGEQKRKFLHSEGFVRDFYLYGEHLCRDGGREHGVVVEGFFDVMYLRQHGYNAVGVMGTHLSGVQREKLVRFFGSLTIIPDGDDAGIVAADRMRHALSKRISVRVAKPLPGRDPDDYTPEELLRIVGNLRQ